MCSLQPIIRKRNISIMRLGDGRQYSGVVFSVYYSVLQRQCVSKPLLCSFFYTLRVLSTLYSSEWLAGAAECWLLWGFTEFVPPAVGLQGLIKSNLLFSHAACRRNLILALIHAIHLGFWFVQAHPLISYPFPSHLFTWCENPVEGKLNYLFCNYLF